MSFDFIEVRPGYCSKYSVCLMWALGCVRLCVCVGGVYELWERFRPIVCARSSVSHQSAIVETLDMPMFILVPAGVLCASSHQLFFVKGHITLPALLQVPPRPAARDGPLPIECGHMMSVVWCVQSLCPVHADSQPPCPGGTEGLCHGLRL